MSSALTTAELITPVDLQRILKLPQRQVLDCERERGARRWTPAAQALIEVVTEKFTRGTRLSCGCGNRHVVATSNGGLIVYHEARPNQPPPPGIQTTIEAFCTDNAHNPETCKLVGAMKTGEELALPGLGYRFCITELNPVQAWTLWELPRAGGAIGFVSVGGGKTASSILAPLAMPSCRTVILLVKPDQRLHYRAAYLRWREHFQVPSIVFDKSDMTGSYIVPGTPVLHVVPYSLLSNPKSTLLLEQIIPDMMIADECFPARTSIITEIGPMMIGDIVNQRRKVRVLSRNSYGDLEWKPVVRWLRKVMPSKLVRITHEYGSFVCTPEHKVWTEDRGYTRAEKLLGKTLRTLSQKVQVDTNENAFLFSRLSSCRMESAADEGKMRGVQKSLLHSQASSSFFDRSSSNDSLFSSMSSRSPQSNHAKTECGSAVSQESRSKKSQSMGGAYIQRRYDRAALLSVQQEVSNEKERKVDGEILFAKLLKQEREQSTRSNQEACQRIEGLSETARSKGGYLSASAKTSSGKDLSGMQEKVQSTIDRKVESDSGVLFKNLHVHLPDSRSEDCEKTYWSEGSRCFGSNEETQSYAHAGSAGKNDCIVEGSNVSFSWWERDAHRAADGVGDMSRLGDGVSNSNEAGFRSLSVAAFLLQGRLGRSNYQNSNRSRWSNTYLEEVEVSRSKKDEDTQLSRVVSVEVLEQGSDGRFERCIGEDRAVYDLEVADNHNYFAEGALVSNCHLLSNLQSSRTMRLMRYLSRRNDVVFCGWSGSMIKKSMKDVSHLAAHALGLASPYPIMPSDIEMWSNVIDPSPLADTSSPTARSLYQAFAGYDIGAGSGGIKYLPGVANADAVREGHRDRVISTIGVISTRSSSITCSISIKERKPTKMPSIVEEKLSDVRNKDQRADGEVIAEASEKALCARNTASGFYFFWAFPNAKDEDLLPGGLIDDWFAKRQTWNKELRVKLLNSEPHLDSPHLCALAAERAWRSPRYDGELPVWPAMSWPDWAEVKNQVEPDPRVRWIDEFLARDAAQWAKENRGIVWCQTSAFGRKVAQLAGIPYHGGGPNAEARIMAEDGSRSIVVSIRAHGSGRDGLQLRFYKQLIAEIPSSGDVFEQLLGRLAREGQEAETVETDIYMHVGEIKDAMRKALMYAEFIEATTPNRQLLLAADIGFDL